MARKGVSAMQLSKELGCQDRTAWHMLRRVREACVEGTFTLDRVVKADETHVGGRERNKYNDKKLRAGRGTVSKTMVMEAREYGSNVVIKPVEATDVATLIPFVELSVDEGATVYTEELSAYTKLAYLINQYKRETATHSSGEYAR